jgi:hypothetical protein
MTIPLRLPEATPIPSAQGPRPGRRTGEVCGGAGALAALAQSFVSAPRYPVEESVMFWWSRPGGDPTALLFVVQAAIAGSASRVPSRISSPSMPGCF